MRQLLIILILLAQTVVAETVSEDRPELEAQRREFETRLSFKIDNAITTIVDKGNYILDVSVTLMRLPPETVEIGGNEQPERFPLVTDKNFEGGEGLVPLSKIGVWQAGTANTAKRRTITRQIRRFSDMIQTVTVDLYLDLEKVSEVQKRAVDKIVAGILKSSSPVPAVLNISSAKIAYPKKIDESLKTELVTQIKKDLESEKVKEVAKESKKDATQWVSEFKIPIAIMLTTVMFFALGLIMNRRQALSDERRLRLDEEISKRQEEQLRASVAVDKVENSSGAPGSSASSAPGFFGADSLPKYGVGGFDQFVEIVKQDPSRASYILKQWIYSNDPRAQASLAILPRVVMVDQLTAALQLLNVNDRKEWGRLINKPLSGISFAEYDNYVAMTIARCLVEPTEAVDENVRQLLATVTPQEGADCILADRAVGVLLVQALPSLQVSRIFSLLDAQVIRDVALGSSSMDKTQMAMLGLRFQATLEKIRGAAKAQISAFVERVPELIREVGYAKELALFDSVAQTRNAKMLHQIAMEYFPAELIPDLPSDILKSVFDRLPLAERAELVYSQPEEIRRVFFFAIGEGRVKEILQIEIEEIENNESRKRSVSRATERIWQSFVDRIRTKINSDLEIAHELEPLIDSWAKQRVESVANGGVRVAA